MASRKHHRKLGYSTKEARGEGIFDSQSHIREGGDGVDWDVECHMMHKVQADIVDSNRGRAQGWSREHRIEPET